MSSLSVKTCRTPQCQGIAMPGEIYCDDCLVNRWLETYEKNLTLPLPELACGHPIYNGITVDGAIVCGICTGK